MSRRILQERRVRAIAAVHIFIGAVLLVFTVVSLAIFLSHSHSPRDMAALAVPLIGGMVVIGGAIFAGVSWLLWMYRPIARWTTGALFAYALSLSAYLFLRYTVDGLGRHRGAWSRGEGSAFPQFVGAGLVEAWSSPGAPWCSSHSSGPIRATSSRPDIGSPSGMIVRRVSVSIHRPTSWRAWSCGRSSAV